jgi:hypothetical protein
LLSRLRGGLTFANVISLTALFIALGAGAYAAGLAPNSVKSKHIVDNQVKSGDVRDDSLTDGGLTGEDVREDTLGEVPQASSADSAQSAAQANNAESLDGKDSSAFAPAGAEAWTEVGQPNGPSFASAAPVQNGCAPNSFGGSQQSIPASWSNHDAGSSTWQRAAFYRDPWGTVHLKGLVSRQATGPCPQGFFQVAFGTMAGPISGDDDIFTLPSGYRPNRTSIFGIASAEKHGELRVDKDGAVLASDPSDYGWVSLDGITFRCAPAGQNGCP